MTEGWYLVVSKSDGGWCLLVFKSEGSSPGRLIEGARRGRAGGEGLASILGQSRVYYGHVLENLVPGSSTSNNGSSQCRLTLLL